MTLARKIWQSSMTALRFHPFDLLYVDEFIHLLHHLREDILVAVQYDGHAGERGVFRRADGEGVYVVPAPREQRRNARQNAAFVGNERAYRILVHIRIPPIRS